MVPWHGKATAMAVSWHCNGGARGLPFQSCGIDVVLLWHCHHTALAVPQGEGAARCILALSASVESREKREDRRAEREERREERT